MYFNLYQFWDSNSTSNSRLTNKSIKMAEQKLGVDLPELYIDLLKVQNGGYTKGFAYPMTIETSWSKNHIPLYELFGIDLYHGPGNSSNILYSTYMIEEWGLPEKQVLLSGDGHWWITLDYRKSTIPSVNWIDCECSEDIHVANNFTDFINGLVSEEAFAD
ncbi:hypothetical protein A3850_011490 [Lewinella sp. 4G2]|nr:hypothetical protein A3850_011490 [Lewinella sp. 4G2]